jgi:hypothetical protein
VDETAFFLLNFEAGTLNFRACSLRGSLAQANLM